MLADHCPQILQARTRCPLLDKEMAGNGRHCAGVFHIDGDQISNDRLTKERQKVEAKSEVRRSAGAMGGTAKALKTKKQHLANAVAKPCHSPEPDTISDTNVSDTDGDLLKAFDAYQATAERLKAEHGKTVWPAVSKFTDKRRARLKARLKKTGLRLGASFCARRALQHSAPDPRDGWQILTS